MVFPAAYGYRSMLKIKGVPSENAYQDETLTHNRTRIDIAQPSIAKRIPLRQLIHSRLLIAIPLWRNAMAA